MSTGRNPMATSAKDAENLTQQEARAEGNLHQLSVGSIDRRYMLHDSMLPETGCRFSVVADDRNLWAISEQEAIHLVILQDSLSLSELDEASRFIRPRWPTVKILVIRAGEDSWKTLYTTID